MQETFKFILGGKIVENNNCCYCSGGSFFLRWIIKSEYLNGYLVKCVLNIYAVYERGIFKAYYIILGWDC